MFNPVQEVKKYLAKKNLEQRQQKYMELLKAGGLFVDWIYRDIADTEKHGRPERRRFQHQLDKTGKLSSEMATYYFQKLENVLAYIEKYKEMEKNAKAKAKQVQPHSCSKGAGCQCKESPNKEAVTKTEEPNASK